MLDFLDPEWIFVPRLLLAALLGAVVGFEREYFGKAAGLRTFSLVSLGACLFTVLSLAGFQEIAAQTGAVIDPSRIAAQVVVGIGFLGAGLIIFRGFRVEGLTTAAGLWVSSAIGMSVGVGMYLLAAVTSILMVIIFFFLKRIEPEEHDGHRDHAL